MAASPITTFLTALQNIRGAGRFCAQGTIPFVPPGIVLKNGDDLALPLSASQAAELRRLAEPAPYGMGAETRLDETVRKSWQIDASELRWTSKKWQSVLDSLVKKIAKVDFMAAFQRADREVWAALLRGFGARPLEFFQAHSTLTKHGLAWFCALDAMLGHAPALLPQHADMPCKLITAQILPARAHSMDDEPFRKPAYHAHLVLAASCIVKTKPERQKITSWLLNDGKLDLPHLRSVLAPALLERKHRAWFKKEHSLAPDIHQAAIAHLAAEIARPIQPYADQRRPTPAETSTDPLIHALLLFMADPATTRHEIRRAQAERSRVEDYVKRHELDLDLHTERKGTPHTLICRKNDHSYHRALKQRAADEKLLERLREVETER